MWPWNLLSEEGINFRFYYEVFSTLLPKKHSAAAVNVVNMHNITLLNHPK